MPKTLRRVRIETLAPTGEGVARSQEGVGFVAGALPGEEVDAEVVETRKRFWKGRVAAIHEASPDRLTGGHADGCPGCDWAHLPLERAAEWKRTLFRQTMERIGGLPPEIFGDLPLAPSPPGYRLRNRFHVSGRGSAAAVGFFAPRTHRVEPAHRCEALDPGMRARLPEIAAAVASADVAMLQIETVESFDASHRLARATLDRESVRADAHRIATALGPLFDGVTVAGARGEILATRGQTRLSIRVGPREFPVAAGTFFQGNRFLVEELYRGVAAEAARTPAGRALDAFAGVGLFAGALLDGGHEVVSIEADQSAVGLALEASPSRGEQNWTIVRSAVLPFLKARPDVFDVAVVDPPRAGLGLPLAEALPDRVSRSLVYVSCDPATLARDLAAMRERGLDVRKARLFDLFAFTHRVEALVSLERARAR